MLDVEGGGVVEHRSHLVVSPGRLAIDGQFLTLGLIKIICVSSCDIRGAIREDDE